MIKNEIENICSRLNIQNIRFKVINENTTNAFSGMNEDGVWEVSVTSQFITKLGNMLKNDDLDKKKVGMENVDIKCIFLVTVGHEIGHIFYKDIIYKNMRILLSILIYFCINVIGLLLLTMVSKSLILAILGGILLFFDWLFGWIMCDKRYWGQVAEFKADRIAVNYVDGGGKAFSSFWLSDECIKMEEDSTQEIRVKNVVYRYYKKILKSKNIPAKNEEES